MPHANSRKTADTHWTGVRAYASHQGGVTLADGSQVDGQATVWADPKPKAEEEGGPKEPDPTPSKPPAEPALPPERNEWSADEVHEQIAQALLSDQPLFASPVLPSGMTWTFHRPRLTMVSHLDMVGGRALAIQKIQELPEAGLVQGPKEILHGPEFALAAVHVT